MSIGERVRTIREFKKLKQEYVADRLGLSQSAYSDLEASKTRMTLDRLQQLSDVLDTPIEDFLNGQALVINTKDQNGSNGYRVDHHQYFPSEAFQQILEVVNQMIKEQQEQNAKVLALFSGMRPKGE